MSARRVPILPTLIVLLAVGTMIGLGVWQLRRLAWKEALLARYAAAGSIAAEVPFPMRPDDVAATLYRRSRVTCLSVSGGGAVSGRNANDQPGWVITAHCRTQAGPAEVVLGWAAQPTRPAWRGGTVSGTLGPGTGGTARLFADPPQAGLAPLARPNPRNIPNNHFAYAVQWFLFACVALVIYGVALRRRMTAA